MRATCARLCALSHISRSLPEFPQIFSQGRREAGERFDKRLGHAPCCPCFPARLRRRRAEIPCAAAATADAHESLRDRGEPVTQRPAVAPVAVTVAVASAAVAAVLALLTAHFLQALRRPTARAVWFVGDKGGGGGRSGGMARHERRSEVSLARTRRQAN